MVRQQTAAAERTEQNKRLRDRVAAEKGVSHVTQREAVAYRKSETESAAEVTSRYLVVDREVLFPEEDRRRIGQVLAKVLDLKVIRGTTLQLTLQSSRDFAHTLTDASLISLGHHLLVTLDELFPSIEPESEDDDESVPS